MSSTNSPTLNRLSTILCWFGSLSAAYFAQNMRERSALGLPDIGPTGSFRERFLLPFLPMSVVGWTIIYIFLSDNTWRCFGFKKARAEVDGYPGWSYQVSLFHGGIILPTLLILANLTYCVETEQSIRSGSCFSTLMFDGTWGTAEALSQVLLEQINCAVIGYLLRDFCGLYPGGLEWGYLLHHIFAIAGCSMCLHFPSLIGIIALNTVQCEFASCVYSLKMLYPGAMINLTYFVVMFCSNVMAVAIAMIVWGSDINYELKYLYAFLTVLIVTLRCGGWFIALRNSCCGGDTLTAPEKTVTETKKDK